MKISLLLHLLGELRTEHGDLDVHVSVAYAPHAAGIISGLAEVVVEENGVIVIGSEAE